MRTIVAAFLAFGIALQAAAPVPRKADEFVFVDPTGKKTTLSSMQGSVVCIQFLYTWCEHCQNTARMLSELQTELAPKGVKFMGVAFNEEVNTKNVAQNSVVTTEFALKFAKFPIAKATKEAVLKQLGMSVMERYAVPQMMVVDKQGVIQAQSKPMGSSELQSPTTLRALLTKLAGAPGGGIKQDAKKK